MTTSPDPCARDELAIVVALAKRLFPHVDFASLTLRRG